MPSHGMLVRLLLSIFVAATLVGARVGGTSARLALSPAEAAPGASVVATGSGFGRNESGSLALDGAHVATFRTTRQGRFSVSWTVPESTSDGNHVVTARTARASASASLVVRRPAQAGFLRGVNLAGGEFGQVPGVYGIDYIYPDAAALDYYQGKGLTLIRLPILWERVQPVLSGPLDEAETGRIERVLADAASRDMRVILDVHNYGRYHGAVIGSMEVSNAAFADLWRRLAGRFGASTALWAYGLMNEPHDMAGGWPSAAQAATDAIRAVDASRAILIAGDGWSNARFWRDANEELQIADPASNLYYEAHIYFDDDYSGRYDQGYDGEGAYPTIGVDRARPFVEWLRDTGSRGFFGEYGVPGDDPRWLDALDMFLTWLDQEGIGGTYWAGGPWWGDYPLSVEPRDGADRPQMPVLTDHLGR